MAAPLVFSVTFRYALISLLEIALAAEGLQAGVIASRHQLSSRYLANVLSELRRLGLVTSHKGRRGGYQLARPANEINLLLLYQSLAGASSDIDTADGSQLQQGALSPADQWMRGLEQRWRVELGTTHLADLIHQRLS